MTTETLLQDKRVLAKTHLYSTWEQKTVAEVVDEWNWNAGIFEIYDQIRDWDKTDINNVLEYAYEYFDKDVMINELASHLLGQGFK